MRRSARPLVSVARAAPGRPSPTSGCFPHSTVRLMVRCLASGPGMDHIAYRFAWAIERSETASALLQLPFYHPMFEEGVKTALREICETVGSPELNDMDFLAAPGA